VSVPYEKIQGLSPYIKPLAYVDVYSTAKNMPYSLENIRIMSFDKAEGATNIKTVTLEIPKYEVATFVDIISNSKILLVSRGENEEENPDMDELNPPKLSPLVINDLEALPPPMNPKGGNISISPLEEVNTVEIIQASTKTQVVFD